MIQDQLYVLTNGCSRYKATIFLYDDLKKSWRSLVELPKGDYMPDVVFVIDQKAYFGLGRMYTKSDPSGFRNMTNIFYAFDPKNLTFKKIARYPGQGRNNLSVFTIGETAYVGLGFGPDRGYQKDFYAYNTTHNQWTRMADFPGKERASAIAFTTP